jgi:xylulokinase
VGQVTVGIDIGTTSVKAVAVDGDGKVMARTRVAHEVRVPGPDRLEHDAGVAWQDNVRRAYREVAAGRTVVAAQVAAMVPSMCAVDANGVPQSPGLLYGDERGATGNSRRDDPLAAGELVGFLRWCAAEYPDAAGYWLAQAVATHALGGSAAMDQVAGLMAVPLHDGQKWDPGMLDKIGVAAEQLPTVTPLEPVGEIDDALIGAPSEAASGSRSGRALLGPGTIDAYAEQLVAGPMSDGDVLVLCGTTLIVWAVIPEDRIVQGAVVVPGSVPGTSLAGGPSNAGGLFLEWAHRLLDLDPRVAASPVDGLDPRRVPVWLPYVRGERAPLHDPARRAGLWDLDLTHGPLALRRAAYEAAGFVVRHLVDLAGCTPRRLVCTGGGTNDRAWMQALADCTAAPVEIAAVPEGAAYGTAFLARVSAGLEQRDVDARRWAATAAVVEPDKRWVEPVAARYRRFRELTDLTAGFHG